MITVIIRARHKLRDLLRYIFRLGYSNFDKNLNNKYRGIRDIKGNIFFYPYLFLKSIILFTILGAIYSYI